MKTVKIADLTIKMFSEPFIIAELGANFNGDFTIAEEMVAKAAKAGVHAAKFQSWTKESIMIKNMYAGKEAELKVFGHKRQEELLDYLSLSEQDHFKAKELCDKYGVLFSSTPISFRHVDLLADLDVPFMKIASMDLNHLSFIEYIAQKNLPAILSTGMGSMEEIKTAVQTFLETGNDQLVLLHCTSLYPPLDEEVNLNNIDYLAEVFDVPIGYSDHTLGYSIPLASVVKGAAVIEKHYTLDKSMEGWDHAVSATPDEFEIIVRESTRIVKALGAKMRQVSAREEAQKKNFRRSIVSAAELPAGHTLTMADLAFKRPGTGIGPERYKELIGKTLAHSVESDHLFNWSDFE